MQRILGALDTIMSAAPGEVGGLVLDTVELTLHVDAQGNIGIAALGGAEVSAGGGIRLVLKKRS
jgi:hypothetical protein